MELTKFALPWNSNSRAFTGSMLLFMCVFLYPRSLTAASLHRHRRQADPGASFNDTLQISDIVGLLGPRNQVDFVTVLDRSQSVGEALFYLQERRILEALFTQYATVHPDYVRTAVVSFSSDASIVYDHISNASLAVTKCELLDGGPLSDFNRVIYTINQSLVQGTQLRIAFSLASQIFTQGKLLRPNATQVMLVMTDGDYEPSEDPVTYLAGLKGAKVTIFSLGLGSWLKTGSVRAFASVPYYYGLLNDWQNLMMTNLSSVSSDTGPFWSPIPDDMCADWSPAGCTVHSACYCDVDRRVRQCLCGEGYQPPANGTTTDSWVSTLRANATCEACPVGTYKDSVGNVVCLYCSPQYVTNTTASISNAACSCAAETCPQDPCDLQFCAPHAVCSARLPPLPPLPPPQDPCACQPGWTSPPGCAVNPNDCLTAEQQQCVNGAHCYDKPGYVQCVCRLGFTGRYCEIDEDDCSFPLVCLNNGTCLDGPNQFTCVCGVGGTSGTFCQNIDPTFSFTVPTTVTSSTINVPTSQPTTSISTTTLMTAVAVPTVPSSVLSSVSSTVSSTVASTTSTISSTIFSSISATSSTIGVVPAAGQTDHTTLIIIVVCSAGGALLLLFIIAVIVLLVLFARRRKRRLAESYSSAMGSSSEISPKHEQHTGSPPDGASSRAVPKTISNSFSGFWKKSTLRMAGGGLWQENASMGSGLPSVPRRRQELDDVADPAAVDREEAIFENELITELPGSAMDGWKSYILEMEKTGAVESAIISELNTFEFAKTSTWAFHRDDITSLDSLMSEESRRPVTVQGLAFRIESNDGFFATGHGGGRASDPYGDYRGGYAGKSTKSKVIAIGKTKNYLIVGVAEAEGNGGRCEKEVQWITDHITTEGY